MPKKSIGALDVFVTSAVMADVFAFVEVGLLRLGTGSQCSCFCRERDSNGRVWYEMLLLCNEGLFHSLPFG